MPKYKNISDVEQRVPGHGIVKPGHEIEIDEDFNNANFELVHGHHKAEHHKPDHHKAEHHKQ